MEYIYAALLLHNAGKAVTEDAVTAVLQAAGIEVKKNPKKKKRKKRKMKKRNSRKKKLKKRKKIPLKKTEWPVSAPSSDKHNKTSIHTARRKAGTPFFNRNFNSSLIT